MVNTAKRSRRSSTTAVPATPASAAAGRSHTAIGIDEDSVTAGGVVVQVLAQHLGRHLLQNDLLACRLVCKDWCKTLSAERKTVDILQLRLDAAGNLPAFLSIPRIFPNANSLSFHVSERISPVALLAATAVLGNNAFYRRLKHLLLASTGPLGSRSSTWPFGMPYWPIQLEGMQGLKSLTFIGRAANTELLQTVAETCTRLTSLVMGLNPEDPLALPSPESCARLATRPMGVQAIAKLTSLRRLALVLEESPWDWDEDERGGGAQLTTLTALTGLTELRLGGAPVSGESARTFLRAAQQLRRLALMFDPFSGRLHERRELALWKMLHHVELQLQRRLLESDIPLLTLGLKNNLRSLHLRSCTVSSYSVTALSNLTALTELSFDAWQPIGLTVGAQEDDSSAAAAVRTALVELLAGPLGMQLEVLRMDLSDPSKDIYGDMARLAETWAQGSLRVLHLVNTDGYSLSFTGALASLAGLTRLRDLRVSVQGQACRDYSALKVAWLPPNLTCLELVGIHLPCGEEELLHAEQQSEQQQAAAEGHGGTWEEGQSCGSLQPERASEPAAAAGAGLDCRSLISGRVVNCGHARLRHLQRLSLHSCRYKCCSHLKEALGPALLPGLVSLELNDVSGLLEEHLTGLGTLTGLTNLSVCALSHPSISSSSMLHPLRHLAALDISSGQWWRMSRWHIASGLGEVLPLCELTKQLPTFLLPSTLHGFHGMYTMASSKSKPCPGVVGKRSSKQAISYGLGFLRRYMRSRKCVGLIKHSGVPGVPKFLEADGNTYARLSDRISVFGATSASTQPARARGADNVDPREHPAARLPANRLCLWKQSKQACLPSMSGIDGGFNGSPTPLMMVVGPLVSLICLCTVAAICLAIAHYKEKLAAKAKMAMVSMERMKSDSSHVDFPTHPTHPHGRVVSPLPAVAYVTSAASLAGRRKCITSSAAAAAVESSVRAGGRGSGSFCVGAGGGAGQLHHRANNGGGGGGGGSPLTTNPDQFEFSSSMFDTQDTMDSAMVQDILGSVDANRAMCAPVQMLTGTF
ncbi:hypothetical protein VOLCADRAFT_93200 [Volvox carteri f. nagariensis]|uniref:F-box domain-containing protein n=1 Tax=Volvox carteri f. nagariensis TaxID=3068 RepID=D8U1J8_VOLCA|nr:uncharacterized protein VOLCADRAFT_93200 [Volvox carteri f. nagariensis]EFJ46424.1 hypothetical protein VOLCADRAFT_93200 [Volvox carteri f. nagariensis]|eukprot:XP_002952577.1 hypothetical protein VOLCADRAFT_93200 [Volvox carteri f. nagariensis]